MDTTTEKQENAELGDIEMEDDFDLFDEDLTETKEKDDTVEETDEEKAEKEKIDNEEGKEKKKEVEETEEEKLEREKAEKEEEERLKNETPEEKLAREEKEKADKKEKPKEKKEEDIFDVPDPEQVEKERSSINYKSFGKEKFDIDIEENDPELLVDAINKKIEDATQKTTLDLSKYNDEQKALINALENGNQKEFLDPLSNLNNYILQPDRAKVAVWLKFEEKVPEAEIQGKIDEMIEAGTFDDKVSHILKEIDETKDVIQREIIEKVNARAEKVNVDKQNEQKGLLKVLNDTETFMGKKIPEKAKKFIEASIKTGSFTRKNNNAETQMKAHLFDLFGDKILKEHQEKLKEAKRAGYKDGSEKETAKLHDKPKSDDAKSMSDDSKSKVDDDDPLGDFKDLEDGAIDGFGD